MAKKLKLLAHSSAAGLSGVEGAVYSAPSGQDITGSTKYGEFESATWAAGTGGDSGYAVLKVLATEWGGDALSVGASVIALARTSLFTTSFCPGTVIDE